MIGYQGTIYNPYRYTETHEIKYTDEAGKEIKLVCRKNGIYCDWKKKKRKYKRLNKRNKIDVKKIKYKWLHELTFEDFGAVGDGITDDTKAIKKAMKHGVGKGKNGRNYKIVGPIEIPSNLTLSGRGI